MRRNIVLLALALSIVSFSLASTARARGWSVTAFGGAAIPMGDFADKDKTNAQTGWQAGGSVDCLLNQMWAFGLDGSWNRNPNGIEGETIDLGGGAQLHSDEDKFETWQFGAHAKYLFPMNSALKPYAVLGLGVYNMKETWNQTTTLSANSTADSGEIKFDSRFGGKAGLGAVWMANPTFGINVDGDFNFISLDKAKADISSAQYFGLKAGVVFMIPSAK